MVTTLHGLELVRDDGDLFEHLSKKGSRLSRPRVVNHVWIVSSILNVRATGVAVSGSSNQATP
jgi:hypothetical protein